MFLLKIILYVLLPFIGLPLFFFFFQFLPIFYTRWIFHSITSVYRKAKLAEASMGDRFFLISLLPSAMTLFQQGLT